MAKERGMPVVEVLSHDLVGVSPLFDGDCPADASKEKHNLVSAVEALIGQNKLQKFDWRSVAKTNVFIDVMSRLRCLFIYYNYLKL